MLSCTRYKHIAEFRPLAAMATNEYSKCLWIIRVFIGFSKTLLPSHKHSQSMVRFCGFGFLYWRHEV